MQLGYFTMPLHPPGSNVTQTLADDLDQLVVLDKLGYKEAWIGEHFTTQWENIPAPDLFIAKALGMTCLLYTSPSPRDGLLSRMPSSA